MTENIIKIYMRLEMERISISANIGMLNDGQFAINTESLSESELPAWVENQVASLLKARGANPQSKVMMAAITPLELGGTWEDWVEAGITPFGIDMSDNYMPMALSKGELLAAGWGEDANTCATLIMNEDRTEYVHVLDKKVNYEHKGLMGTREVEARLTQAAMIYTEFLDVLDQAEPGETAEDLIREFLNSKDHVVRRKTQTYRGTESLSDVHDKLLDNWRSAIDGHFAPLTLVYVPCLPLTPAIRKMQEQGITNLSSVVVVDPSEFEGLILRGAAQVLKGASWQTMDDALNSHPSAKMIQEGYLKRL